MYLPWSFYCIIPFFYFILMLSIHVLYDVFQSFFLFCIPEDLTLWLKRIFQATSSLLFISSSTILFFERSFSLDIFLRLLWFIFLCLGYSVCVLVVFDRFCCFFCVNPNIVHRLTYHFGIAFKQGKKACENRLSQWFECIKRGREVFGEVEKSPLEHILQPISDFGEDADHPQKFKTMTLRWENHCVYEGTPKNSVKLASEHGCALVFSLDPTGRVVCILSPFRSDWHSFPESYLIAKIYKTPAQLTKREFYKMLRYFFAYSLSTSLWGAPRISDQIIVRWIKIMNCFHSRKWRKYILSVLTAVVEHAF
ncbi:hypothetical protein FF3_00258 [Fretibacterium fastidiosum]